MMRYIRESLKPTDGLVLVGPTSRLVASDREAQRGADVLSAQLAVDDLRKADFHITDLNLSHCAYSQDSRRRNQLSK